MKLTLTIPKPPRELSPNARGHWGRKYKATARYRDLVKVLAREVWNLPPMMRVTVRTTWHVPDRRRRDQDNALASLKAAFDGLVDAGVIEDDSGLTPEPVVFVVDKDAAARPRGEIDLEIEA